MADILGVDEYVSVYPTYVPPSEALRGKDIEIINFPVVDPGEQVVMKIIDFPDYVGGNLIKIPLIAPKRVDLDLYDDQFTLWLKGLQSTLGYRVGETRLSGESRDRLTHCLKDLGLPVVLATHLAFNRKDIELSDFPTVESPSIAVSIEGMSGSGKSLLVALLSQKFEEKIFSYDQFSRFNPNAYLEEFSKAGLNENSEVSTFLSAVRRMRERDGSKRINGNPLSLSTLLDEMLDLYKSNNRPDILVVEGVDRPRNGKDLQLNVLHLVSLYGSECTFYIYPPGDDVWQESSAPTRRDSIGWYRNPDYPQLGIFVSPDETRQSLEAQDFEFALDKFKEFRPEILERARLLHQSFAEKVSNA